VTNKSEQSERDVMKILERVFEWPDQDEPDRELRMKRRGARWSRLNRSRLLERNEAGLRGKSVGG